MRRDCHFALLCVVGALVRGRGAGVRAGAGPGAGSRFGAVLAQGAGAGLPIFGRYRGRVTPAKETLLSI